MNQEKNPKLDPYIQIGSSVTLYVGDMRVVLAGLDPDSIDACVCDPPYELGFMGQAWDGSKVAYDVEAWRAVYRVLKPGAHLLAFGGSRTHHRIWCAIEDAGFEVRDTIAWIYSSGFPKSLNVSRMIDMNDGRTATNEYVLRWTKWLRSTGITARQVDDATDSYMSSHYMANKSQPAIPTLEHWAILREILHDAGTEIPDWVEEAVQVRNIGSENVKLREATGEVRTVNRRPHVPQVDGDHGENEWAPTAAYTPEAQPWEGWGTALRPSLEPVIVARKPVDRTVAANVLAYGTGAMNVDGCRFGDAVMSVTKSDGTIKSGNIAMAAPNTGRIKLAPTRGRWPANVVFDEHAASVLDSQAPASKSPGGPVRYSQPSSQATTAALDDAGEARRVVTAEGYGDSGGPSRFFPVFRYESKPGVSEREHGCEDLSAVPAHEVTGRKAGSAGQNNPRAGVTGDRGRKNTHATVKPIELMRWLVRLVTPPGGVVLDPFTGSGTTGCAAMDEGFRFVGIELGEKHAEIAAARMQKAHSAGTLKRNAKRDKLAKVLGTKSGVGSRKRKR